MLASLRALAPSLTRITVAAAVGAAAHVGQGDCDLIDRKQLNSQEQFLHKPK